MIDILMPRLSDTMDEGAISTWHKQPGDPVTVGDVLVDIETDKAVMEYEAYEAGTLAEILVHEGESATIGTAIARLDNGTGEETMTLTHAQAHPFGEAAQAAGERSPAGTPGDRPSQSASTPTGAPSAATARLRATPLVRKVARERGIDLTTITGTGPGGRIIRADLYAAEGEPAPEDLAPESRTSLAPAASTQARETAGHDGRGSTATPFDPIRRTIASRLTETATTVPAFGVTSSADVTDLLDLRVQLNDALADTGGHVTVNDLLVRAVALALRSTPGVNASYSPEGRGQTLLHGRINVGIAVASPAGLMVPVIRDADQASVTTIAVRSRALAEKAMNRTLSTADMADGTFTISNLGMYGVEHFTAVINAPQGAILAVGAATPEPTVADAMVVVRRRMRYTITADHRIIDGALAAQFLATLTGLLERPLRILA
ncbi:dihydrolipoamide acetyltransferase family protein [Nonomuraea sp. NPDC005650]|uniref:dihydrolipoamide acetyltransferase family protein n=1 Tax=Nonomuraea sp. NPDC005650 TaxID=3157045 RepID=UPI0033BADAE9